MEESASNTKPDAMTASSAITISNVVSSIKYRHMTAIESQKDFTYYNLIPDFSALDSPIIAANENYWAIPYRGGGQWSGLNLINLYKIICMFFYI